MEAKNPPLFDRLNFWGNSIRSGATSCRTCRRPRQEEKLVATTMAVAAKQCVKDWVLELRRQRRPDVTRSFILTLRRMVGYFSS